MRLAWLPILLLTAGAPLAALAQVSGVVPRPHPGDRIGDPLLVVLEGLDPRPTPDWPVAERLGFYRSYRILGTTGRVFGYLNRQAWTALPAFVIFGQAGEPKASLVADRRPGNGFRVLNAQLRPIGRWFPLRSPAGAYEWRLVDETAIGVVVPRAGTNLLDLRGNAKAVELLQRFGIPVSGPAAQALAFQALHRDLR